MEPVPAVPPGMEPGPKACSLSPQFFSRMKPRVCVVLRFGLDDVGVGDGGDLRAGVEVLGETGNAGVGVRRECGIVLVVVLEREVSLRVGIPVKIGDCLSAVKRPVPGMKALSRWATVGATPPSAVVGYEPLAGLAGKRGRVEELQGERIDVGRQ